VVGEAATSASPNALYAFKEDPAVQNGSSPNFTDGPGKKLVDPTSSALGINAGGQIVGQNNLSQAYRYTPGAPASFLTLSAPSTATAINDAGTFVGVRDVSGQERAFLHDGVVQDLLPAVQAASEATAINNDGDVAGSIAVPRGGMGNVKNEAFLLRSGAAAHEGLGLVAGYDESFARGVNIERWVVGEATGMGQARTAWLWADGQIFDLSTQLDWDWVDPQAPDSEKQVGWTRLLAATAVNDAGYIVGQGKYQLVQGVAMDRAGPRLRPARERLRRPPRARHPVAVARRACCDLHSALAPHRRAANRSIDCTRAGRPACGSVKRASERGP
jgi:probable HAF family extracellular repeat protein